jgi:hypothetical protein
MFAITHNMAIGHNFDGDVPSSTPVTTNGVKEYPVDAVDDHGGLFEFTGSERRAITILGIQIKFGGQSTWAITILDPVVGSIPLINSTTETSYLRLDVDAFTLLPGQKIKLVTTGTIAAAMKATVLFAPAQLGEV